MTEPDPAKNQPSNPARATPARHDHDQTLPMDSELSSDPNLAENEDWSTARTWTQGEILLPPEMFEHTQTVERKTSDRREPAKPATPVITQFGNYEELVEIARGGMGVVYRARQKGLKRKVALKMILAGQLASPSDVQRFLAEAQAVAQLEHPGIVRLYEIGEISGQHFYTMEYIEGESLANLLQRGPLQARRSAEMARKMALAMDYAHQRGIIHRDLKPQNILLADGIHPKVADFGLSKSANDQANLTLSGQIVGTPNFMPPEQAVGSRQIGPTADVYSLGAILYNMLTGRPPFQVGSVMALMNLVQNSDPLSIRLLNPSVPRDLETICMKCLEKTPARRYSSAGELAKDLERWLDGKPILARPVGMLGQAARWCRRNPSLAILFHLAILFAISVTWQWRREASARHDEAIARADAENAASAERQARADAEKEHQRARRLAAEAILNQGLVLCQQEHVHEGILHLVRALEVAPTDLQPDVRDHLGAWYRQVRPLHGILPHREAVHAVAISPNGRTVVTASADKTAQLWDTATLGKIGAPLEHRHFVVAAAFSPHGQLVATASWDQSARLWDAITGKPASEPLLHQANVTALRFSPDGKWLLTASDDRTARLWDVSTGKPMGKPLSHQGEIRAIVFSKDGKRVLTGSEDRSGKLWDAATGDLLIDDLKHADAVVAVGMNDGILATASIDGTVRLWEEATGKPRGFPLRHRGAVTALAFSPKANLLATAGADGWVYMWDQFGQLVTQPLNHSAPVRALAFRSDGLVLATACDDQYARLWEVETGRQIASPLAHDGAVTSITFSPDGKLLVCGTDHASFPHGEARLWDLAAAPARELQHNSPVTALSFHPKIGILLTGCNDGTARLWDVNLATLIGKPIRLHQPLHAVTWNAEGNLFALGTWTGGIRVARASDRGFLEYTLEHNGWIEKLIFSPDGQTLWSASGDTTVQGWHVLTGTRRGNALGHGGPVTDLALSAGGEKLLTASGDGNVQLWSTNTGAPLGPRLAHAGEVWAAAFSPDGRILVSACGDSTARIWDTESMKPLGRPMRHQGAVRAISFSPDGQKILTASTDHSARLWRAENGAPSGPPMLHRAPVTAVAFSPDGSLLLTACADGTARLWLSDSSKPLGPALIHRGAVRSVSFSPNGQLYVTAGEDHIARLWQTPQPRSENVEDLRLWLETRVGLEADDSGIVVVLDADTWYQRRAQLKNKAIVAP